MGSRRSTLGAGALLSVLLLVVAAAVALGVYYSERADSDRRAEDREAGRVFALWFGAAHRASMEQELRVPVAGGGFVAESRLLSLSDLETWGAVPPGLPDSVGKSSQFTLGVIDDGAGVLMAFGVLEPQPWANTASLREGALEGGLAQVEVVSEAGSAMHQHLGRIEALLGRSPAADALFVTADGGVRYRDGVVYRRAQPGHRYLNRMETDLDAGGCGAAMDAPCDLEGGGLLAALEVSVTPDSLAPEASTVGGHGFVGDGVESGSLDVVGTCRDADGQEVFCSASVTTPEGAGNLMGFEVSGTVLTVHDNLVVGSAQSEVFVVGVASDPDAVPGDVDVTGHVQSAAVNGTTVTAQDGAVTGAVTVTGASTIGTLSGSTLTVASGLGTGSGTFERLYGPSASIGTLTVDSCEGCYPE